MSNESQSKLEESALDEPALAEPALDEVLPRRGAFRVSEVLRGFQSGAPIALDGPLELQHANELRLLLRGESVVDWHRLDYSTYEDSRRLLALNALDWDDPRDRERIETLRAHAADYLRRILKLSIDDDVASEASFLDLPLMASGVIGLRKQQRNACTLLKVMHILYHLDARELRTRLALSDSELFESVERSVLDIFDQLQASGAPVVEFQWSRKTRESLLTKMLVKRETSAARVFDRLRFRLIVKRRSDVAAILRLMLHKLIPFNYVVPGQTVNSLIDVAKFDRVGPSPLTTTEGRGADTNEFSDANFRVLNFIADLPVRVDEFVPADQLDVERGNVVFVLAEFQILDAATAAANEEGEASHEAYKTRQHQRVRERMLRAPNESRNGRSGRDLAEAPLPAQALTADDPLARIVQVNAFDEPE